MGISPNQFYINFISASINKIISTYDSEQICEELFESLRINLIKGKLSRLEMSNTEADLSMSVFYESGLSHLGVIDSYNDINYYYNDGSGNNSLIPIDGDVFRKWMVCENDDLLWEAVLFFAHKGKRISKINWVKE